MRRLGRIVGVVVGVMVVLPAAAPASHTPAGEPFGEDFVAGAFFTGVANLTIDARSGASGENPTGEATADDGVGRDTGRVTCLYVAGNRATVGVDFTSVGGGFFFVEDRDGDGPDLFAGVGTPTGEAPSVCPADSPRPLIAVAGDIVVHDAPPLPTTKAQCKHGGWRNYGTTFKNQGQCVSFVATGGKHQP